MKNFFGAGLQTGPDNWCSQFATPSPIGADEIQDSTTLSAQMSNHAAAKYRGERAAAPMNTGAFKLNYPKNIPSEAIGARTREAWQPFADFMSAPLFEKLSNETRLTAGSPMARRQLTVGDLRKLADAILSLSGPTREEDPADVWDAYCAEVPEDRRSPQGAMAFALSRPDSGGAA